MKIKLYGIELETLETYSQQVYSAWNSTEDDSKRKEYYKLMKHVGDAQQKGLSKSDVEKLKDIGQYFLEITMKKENSKIYKEYLSLDAYYELREKLIKDRTVQEYIRLYNGRMNEEKKEERLKNCEELIRLDYRE